MQVSQTAGIYNIQVKAVYFNAMYNVMYVEIIQDYNVYTLMHISIVSCPSIKSLLFASIPHLDSSCEPLELSVHGRSLMPYCHFDLEQSDYLSRRPADGRGVFGGSFDPTSTRVIEFHSCGIGVKTTKYDIVEMQCRNMHVFEITSVINVK